MKKERTMLLAAACCISLAFAGCGSGKSAPENAADLLSQYQTGSHDNYNMSLSVDMDMTMGTSGINFEIPVSIEEDVDIAGSYGHGDMTMTIDMSALSSLMSLAGADSSYEASETKQAYEIYIDTSSQDSAVMYTAEEGSDDWGRSETDISMFTTLQNSLLADGVFDDAEMTYDKDKKEYTVVMPFSAVLDNEEVGDALSESFSVFGSMGLTDEDATDAMLNAFKNVNMTYVFDEDLNPLSMSMDEFSFETTMDESGVECTVDLDMTMGYVFSNFGAIKEEDVKVPTDIAEGASDSGSLTIEDTEDEIGSEIEEDVDDLETDSEIAAPVDFKASDDILGKVNGVELQAEGNDFAKTFGALGFTFDESDDGQYSFTTTEYSKSNYVDLEVFNAARDTSTIADIKENGFAGYEISYYGDDNFAEAPEITWKDGITWGSTAEEVEAAYGTPAYTSEGDGVAVYSYQLSDQVEIEFYVYTEDYEYSTRGVGYVEVDVFNW